MTEENKDNNKSVQKSEVAKNEERVLEFWEKSNTFKKSEEKPAGRTGGDAPNGQFVFYDGPPFATGLPHHGHILGSVVKDVVGRYKTMQGYTVPRKWGWDCHGLPIENIVEKDLDISGREGIEKIGICSFNECARSKVSSYVGDWKKTVDRIGRWVDFDGSYKTMDNDFIESVWWGLKEINNKGLLYEGVRVLPYCPRCETTVSNSEIAMDNSYKDIKDISVTVEFELEDPQESPQDGQAKTYVLAWTTTPWTLPGNVALAVGKDIDYVKIEKKDEGDGGIVRFILAKNKLEKVFKDSEYKIIEEFKGSELVGKKYKPVFDYYADNKDLENRDNGWKIYDADFVTTEEGTGIVHIAPAFGEDDLELLKKNKLPIIKHVDSQGRFKKEVKDFAGLYVKPKDNHQITDIEIIKYLANKGVLFAKEKIEHSYPHCFRCDTPLFYYALPSWFINIQKIKDKVLKSNESIHWVPEHLKHGRFENILKGAPDWNISRTRYWASPLPIWKCEECEEIKVVGSIDEVREEVKKTGNRNKYFVIRHGEAENNILQVLSKGANDEHHLTERGKEQILASAQELKTKGIDLIINSPFVRTKESAKILAKELKVKEIVEDKRIGEVNSGVLGGKACPEYYNYFSSEEERFTKTIENGENFNDIKKRVSEFLYDIDKKYSDKNILIISHENPSWLLRAGAQGMNSQEAIKLKEEVGLPKNAQWYELDFIPVSHNRNYELDLHRPYIDDVEFKCECGGKMKRIPEVFDCWFESGSMPYASNHYPFENLDKFNPEKGVGFPADFIAEYIAQTRTWFYYMHVVSILLFGETSFKNVVTTGNVLAEDGQKMSKSKKNFPDPLLVIDRYGVDSLRQYLLSSTLMKSEDLNFVEKGVDEVLKKIVLKTKNVCSFYELYKNDLKGKVNPQDSKNVLDQWILSRLNQLIEEATKGLDNYELDRASRPIMDFVEDLSTWYLRRSRNRFKGEDQEDKNKAIATTKYVLENLAKIYAPFMPFVAEEVWQKVTENNFTNEDESVHLEDWPSVASSVAEAVEDKKAVEGKPKASEVDKTLLEEMEEVRKIVSFGLEARAKEGVKVRQPLQKLKIKNDKLKMKEELLELVKDELNVKEIVFDENIKDEVELDLEITPELQEEGYFREFLRSIQIMRKNAGLNPKNKIDLGIETNNLGKELIEKFEDGLKRIAGVDNIDFEEVIGEELEIGKYQFKVVIN